MYLWIGGIAYGLESNVWNSGLGFGAQGFQHLSEKQTILDLKYGLVHLGRLSSAGHRGFRKGVRQHLPTIA